MEKIVSAIRVQDLVLVIVCGLSIYLLRARNSFVLQPAWRQELNPKRYENNRFPAQDEWLPGPVITDLDGDNVVEVVLLTTEYELRVTKVPVRNETEFRLPDLITLHSIKLPFKPDEDVRFCRAVALETGYLAPPTLETESRKQVIRRTWPSLHFCFTATFTAWLKILSRHYKCSRKSTWDTIVKIDKALDNNRIQSGNFC